MKRAIAVTVAVLVSIIWLSPPVAIGAAMLGLWSPQDYIPPEVSQIIAMYNIDPSQIPGLVDLQPATPDQESGEPVVAIETPTPEPATATPTPEPPTATPTPEPPTETPTPTATFTAREAILATIQAAQAVTETAEIEATIDASFAGVSAQVIVPNGANVRSGPGPDFDTVGQIAAGAEITVVGQDVAGDWFLLEDGTWIFASDLIEEPVVPVITATPTGEGETTGVDPAPEAPTLSDTARVSVTVTSDSNLRAGPGVTFDNIGGVTANSPVIVVGRFASDDWYLLENGAWIFGALLSQAVTEVPLVNEQGQITEGPNAGQPVLPPSDTTAATPTPEAAAPTSVETTTTVTANLRGGPATTFEVVGSVEAGATVVVTGQNNTGDWFQLQDGSWVFGELLTTPPTGVPVVTP